ncbi:MAG: hypothetical protein WCK02_02375 [Bacteroidota bacterium]
MKQFLTILFFIVFINSSKSQTIVGAGVGAIYNFQANGFGADVRVLTHLYRNIYAMPRFAYFPGNNKINEFYAGADIDWFLANIKKKYTPYIFTGFHYNCWLNNIIYNSEKATKNNLAIEPGLGFLIKKGCYNPYIETRYNTKWKEFSLEIGIIFKFGECFGMTNGFSVFRTSKGRKNANKCPNF